MDPAEAEEMRRERRRRRRQRLSNCCKQMAAFAFSHIGLAAMVVAYSIMGGFLFRAIEAPAEFQMKLEVQRVREEKIVDIWRLARQLQLQQQRPPAAGDWTEQNFTTKVRAIMVEFQGAVFHAVKDMGWDGNDEANETQLQWSFAGALLYAVTVITTIGYGHVAPKTALGRILTMIYALIGIPLTFLYLSNIGNFMANCFRIFYKRVCCDILCCQRCDRARQRERRKQRRLRELAVQRNILLGLHPAFIGCGGADDEETSGRPTAAAGATGTRANGEPYEDGGGQSSCPVRGYGPSASGGSVAPPSMVSARTGSSSTTSSCRSSIVGAELNVEDARETAILDDDYDDISVRQLTTPSVAVISGSAVPAGRQKSSLVRRESSLASRLSADSSRREFMRHLADQRETDILRADSSINVQSAPETELNTMRPPPSASASQRNHSASQPNRTQFRQLPVSDRTKRRECVVIENEIENNSSSVSGSRQSLSSVATLQAYPATVENQPRRPEVVLRPSPTRGDHFRNLKNNDAVVRHQLAASNARQSLVQQRLLPADDCLESSSSRSRRSSPSKSSAAHKNPSSNSAAAANNDLESRRIKARANWTKLRQQYRQRQLEQPKSAGGSAATGAEVERRRRDTCGGMSSSTAPPSSRSMPQSSKSGSNDCRQRPKAVASKASDQRLRQRRRSSWASPSSNFDDDDDFETVPPSPPPRSAAPLHRHNSCTPADEFRFQNNVGGGGSRNARFADDETQSPPEADEELNIPDEIDVELMQAAAAAAAETYGYEPFDIEDLPTRYLGASDPFDDDLSQHGGKVTVPIPICLVIIAGYIFAGAVLFTLWEDWDYLTGSYFCFITLSTIGFGDIVPGTDMDKWASHEKLVLCALWLAFGLSLLAMCFNLMQEEVKEKCKWVGLKLGLLRDDEQR